MRRLILPPSSCSLVRCRPPHAADLGNPPIPASLVADSLTIQSGSVLVASGHVEIFYQGRHLAASKLTYDRSTNRLAIEGPIWLDDGQGNVLQAQMADLSADLTEGILRSARLVMADRLQLAAGEVIRTAAAATRRCAGSRPRPAGSARRAKRPLWEIRAKSVVHDTLTHQIWFTGAQLRFWGLPVMYLPELRVPDPTLKRATGFLLALDPLDQPAGHRHQGAVFHHPRPQPRPDADPLLDLDRRPHRRTALPSGLSNGNIAVAGAATQDSLLGPGRRAAIFRPTAASRCRRTIRSTST